MTPVEHWTWGFLCGVLTGFGLTVASLAWYMQRHENYSLSNEGDSIHLETKSAADKNEVERNHENKFPSMDK